MDKKIFENTLKVVHPASHKVLENFYEYYNDKDDKFLEWACNTDVILKEEFDAYHCYLSKFLGEVNVVDKESQQLEYISNGVDFYIVCPSIDEGFILDRFKSNVKDSNEAFIKDEHGETLEFSTISSLIDFINSYCS